MRLEHSFLVLFINMMVIVQSQVWGLVKIEVPHWQTDSQTIIQQVVICCDDCNVSFIKRCSTYSSKNCRIWLIVRHSYLSPRRLPTDWQASSPPLFFPRYYSALLTLPDYPIPYAPARKTSDWSGQDGWRFAGECLGMWQDPVSPLTPSWWSPLSLPAQTNVTIQQKPCQL